MKLYNENGLELHIIPCRECLYHYELGSEHYCERHTNKMITQENGFCNLGEKEQDEKIIHTGDIKW